MNRNAHSDFDSFRHVLMNIIVIARVSINTIIENILSYIKDHKMEFQHSQARQFGARCRGVIIEDIPTIHNILNISDPITFHTHISYFFLIIAVSVAAISGRLVHAAIIVAQIAH